METVMLQSGRSIIEVLIMLWLKQLFGGEAKRAGAKGKIRSWVGNGMDDKGPVDTGALMATMASLLWLVALHCTSGHDAGLTSDVEVGALAIAGLC